MQIMRQLMLLAILCAIFPTLTIGQANQLEPIGNPEFIRLSDQSYTGREPNLCVIDSDHLGLTLEFSLPELGIQESSVAGEIFHAIEIKGGAFRGQVGSPMLPTYTKAIQIPDHIGVTVEADVLTSKELTGYRPMPMQTGQEEAEFSFDPAAYARSGYEDIAPVETGAPAIARDLRIVPLTLNPVRYDPLSGRLEIATKIRINISYTGQDSRNPEANHHRIIPQSFHKLYQSYVVNYQGPRSDQVVGLGTYLIICPNNSTVVSKLQPLIEWRTRRGYEVHLATTAETGTNRSSIKNWIQDKYDTWDNPPEYIALIGDSGGSISIPHWRDEYSGLQGEGDHPYVQLAGNDVLADAHIGRISVSSTSQLELYVHKIVSYESTPYMGSTDWYKRGTVVGDPTSSGYSTIQCMQWLKTQMLDHDYAEVDTIFTGPFVSSIISGLNAGNSVFGYRGFGGMSGFLADDIYNLENGREMPFAVIITCNTGTFVNSTSRTEAFIRAGLPPATPSGGIASIGSATGGTHTRYNNCITYGVWDTIFGKDIYQFGASLTGGKYELYLSYAQHDLTNVRIFSHWNNLMGDPGGEIWTDIPQPLIVNHPAEIDLGANSVSVEVTEDGIACAGAYVCLWKDDEIHIGGYTDEGGLVTLPAIAATTGDIKLTVTKHNCMPYLADIPVQSSSLFVGYFSHAIDGDGLVSPNESVGLTVNLKNFGSGTASAVTADISSNDAFITITDHMESFGSIGAGGTAWCQEDFDFSIAPEAPNGHLINLGLNAHSGGDDWISLIQIPVAAPEFSWNDMTLYDVGTRFDPGESGELSIEVRNIGSIYASAVTGTISSANDWVIVTDAVGSFGDISTGDTGENSSNRFGLTIAPECYPGYVATLELTLESASGAIDTVPVSLSIGQISSTDPIGPDTYGYYAYDNTDIAYLEVPAYNWVEIATNYGGPGTSVGLTDFGVGEDDSRTVSLPFNFTYYGLSYSSATICSNGWLAMGATNLTNYRNWTIPCVGAPPNLITPMWDDFIQEGDNRVYHWFDQDNHRYIVQWSRLRNKYPGDTHSTFQVILYDTAHYPTESGNGKIVFQYHTYDNSDSEQMYSTTGIQNGDNRSGVLYSYWDTVSPGGAPIVSGRAIAFQSKSNSPTGIINGHVENSSGGNSDVPGASITFVESGQVFVSNSAGYFGGLAEVGVHTVTATHPCFASVTTNNVLVEEGGTTDLDISMVDNAGPQFTNTTVYQTTGDPVGPYEIMTTVTEYTGIDEILLYYSTNGTTWTPVIMQSLGDNIYSASIPGAPFMTNVKYYLFGRDTLGLESTDPPSGPGYPYSFWVLAALLSNEMEDGTSGWTHDNQSGGWDDQWHLSSSRNHTSDGDTAWKFGSTGTNSYANNASGYLVSPAFDIESDATLTFWHYIDAESEQWGDMQFTDGGLVELSINGGDWNQITPEGGYPTTSGDGWGGPFDEYTPLYSNNPGVWEEASFRLEGYDGSARIRFHFGSNEWNEGYYEGWFIDDLTIYPDLPSLSDTPASDQLPDRLILYQNQPNPISQNGMNTHIRFDLPETTPVKLRIFDAGGRLVNTLVNKQMMPGQHRVSWNCQDNHQREVSSGVYFYLLDTKGGAISRRMMIVR